MSDNPEIERLEKETNAAYAAFLDFLQSPAMTVLEYEQMIDAGDVKMRGTKATLIDWAYDNRWVDRKNALVVRKISKVADDDEDTAAQILRSELHQVKVLEDLFNKMATSILERMESGALKPKPTDLVAIANAFSTIGRRNVKLPGNIEKREASLTLYRGFDGDFSQRSLPEQVDYLKQIASSSLSITEKVAPETEIVEGQILENKELGNNEHPIE